MNVLFFARARDLAGVAEVEVDVAAGESVAALRSRLAEQFPQLRALLPHCAVAVDDVYAEDDAIFTGVERVAVLPPVSGG